MYILMSFLPAVLIGAGGIWYSLSYFAKKDAELAAAAEKPAKAASEEKDVNAADSGTEKEEAAKDDVSAGELTVSSNEITKRYKLLFSLICGGLLLAAAAFFGFTASSELWTEFDLLLTMTVLSFTLFAAVIDLRYQLIPNKLLLAMLGCGALIRIIQIAMFPQKMRAVLLSAVLGMVIAGGIFLIGNLLSRNGLGMGDVKLMALIGFCAGLDSALGISIWAMILAAAAGAALMLFKKAKAKTSIPLGPFFFLGTLVGNVVYVISMLSDK